jgi:formate hydrogenlyase subunit 4
VSAWVTAAVQAVLVAAVAPLLIGLMRAVRARLEGRAGGRLVQPWRDLRKLLRKEPIIPADAGVFFTAAPVVLMATSVLVAAAAPYLSTRGPLSGVADLIVVVGLLLLGAVALALAGLDTGTAFGGMGASREMTIAALVEPTLLLSVFALSTRVGSTDLGAIVAAGARDPARVFTPASALAAAALAIATLAEAGRLPVDNPATHLELTMVHEAMVLEYAGRDLALVATSPHPLAIALAAVVFVAKLAVLGGLLAAGEVFAAKLRLFRVPELLAGSFVLGLLAVITSAVLA